MGLVENASLTIANAVDGIVHRVRNRVNRWLAEEAFMGPVTNLYSSLQSRPVDSQAELQSLIRENFGPTAMQKEFEILQGLIRANVEDDWRKLIASLEAANSLTYSPFQLERAAAFLKHEMVAKPLVGSQVSLATPGPTGGRDTPFGRLDTEDLDRSLKIGTIKGGFAETLAVVGTYLFSGAMSVTGIGLPVAAALSAATLLWTYQRKKRGFADCPQAEFAEMIAQLRRQASEHLLENAYPDKFATTLLRQLGRLTADCEVELKKNLWNDAKTHRVTLNGIHRHLLRGETLLRNMREWRSRLGLSTLDGTRQLATSAASAQALVVFGSTPTRYPIEESTKFTNEFRSVLALEDSELHVIDRDFGAAELDWLRTLPSGTTVRILLYDVERETATRTAFLRALHSLRQSRSGLLAVRAVKIAGHDRTPLDRTLIGGSDWCLELSHSLTALGKRELSASFVSETSLSCIQRDWFDRFWSVEVVGNDPRHSALHILDL